MESKSSKAISAKEKAERRRIIEAKRLERQKEKQTLMDGIEVKQKNLDGSPKDENLVKLLETERERLKQFDSDLMDLDKEEKDVDAMDVTDDGDGKPNDNDGQSPPGQADGNTSPSPPEQAVGNANSSPLSDHSDTEIENEDEDPPGMTAEAFKEKVGLGLGGTVVAYRGTEGWGGETAIVRYGPKSHAIYRIENASEHAFTRSEVPDILKKGYRKGSEQIEDTRRWKYTRAHFVAIRSVAWNVKTLNKNPLGLMYPEDEDREKYVQTMVEVEWEIEKARVRTWETRTVARRVFTVSKKGAADWAIYYQAEAAEDLHTEWSGKKEVGTEKTPVPASQYVKMIKNEEGSGEASRAPSPAKKTTKSPSPKQASKATGTKNTTKQGAQDIEAAKEEFNNDYMELTNKSFGDMDSKEKMEMVGAWREFKVMKGLA